MIELCALLIGARQREGYARFEVAINVDGI
jgi:hypothetical protein